MKFDGGHGAILRASAVSHSLPTTMRIDRPSSLAAIQRRTNGIDALPCRCLTRADDLRLMFKGCGLAVAFGNPPSPRVVNLIRPKPRDFPAQLASGELADELAQMISRYLLKTPPED